MIDIHSHILPGLDDGAENFDDTLIMARAACSEGITTIIATPHHANGAYMNPASNVRRLVESVNARLIEAGVPVTIAAGQEIRVHDDLLDAWSRDELLTLAGSRYVLLEMPSSRIPRSMEEIVHELSVMGLTTVIAHPERNSEVVQHPERFEKLIELGACGQVTTHSLLGVFGKRIQQTSLSLLKQGSIHFVSSDAHHISRRGFRLDEAYSLIERTMGEQWSSYLRDNARRLLDNSPLGEQPASSAARGGQWRRLISLFARR
jgi:protein-tyrosine phosphatase